MTFTEKLKKQVEDLTEERVRAEEEKKLVEEKRKLKEGKKRSAIRMLKDKLSPQTIADYLELSVDEIHEWEKAL